MRKSIPMGLLCAPVGALVGLWVAFTTIGDGYGVFVVAAPIAAFLSGTFAWWLLVIRPDRPRLLRAVLAGALAAVLGHFLCWYLVLVGAFLWHVASGPSPHLAAAPLDPLVAVPAAAVYGAYSLLFFGWLTVPAGALVGGFLAAAQRRGATAAHPTV